jgi:hypothetical protein
MNYYLEKSLRTSLKESNKRQYNRAKYICRIKLGTPARAAETGSRASQVSLRARGPPGKDEG